jgi:starch-binding outer membrane protein, SusD/RagB family
MKNLFKILCFIFIYWISTSCEKDFGTFLAKAPGIDVTEDTIFSSQTNIETMVATTYYWALHTDMAIWDERDKSDSPISGACEETETVAPWFWVHRTWNTGGLSSATQGDMRWVARWKAIRYINIILERMDKAPVPAAYITQVKAEAKFLRALNYFEMFKYYGGVPLVDHRFNLGENLLVPRSTLQTTLDFILKDVNDAIANLPAIYPSALRGRATKEAAYALKSKALLFAASPQFNTATPVLPLPGHNDLICFGSYDPNRWQVAADAAKAAIDAAPASGNFLITNQGVTKNWKYIWEVMDNSEIILAEKSQGTRGYQYFLPASIYSGMQGNCTTLNFVKYYEKLDGTPQTWNDLGGYDLLAKYAQLDPRFAQCNKVQGSIWNSNYGAISMTTLPVGRDASGCFSGVWCKKPIPDAYISGSNQYSNWPIFKVNELYLNYAEALNEANSTPPQAAYDAVHVIRSRSGMPDFPAGMTQAAFRTKLRNERAIELAMDAHRIYDERRWLISDTEGLMKGNMWGIKIYPIAGNPNEFQYVPYVFSVRTFLPRMYLNPFMQTEVNKGYLIQNPGY